MTLNYKDCLENKFSMMSLRREVRHNIEALWNLTYFEKTLGIPEQLPNWVRILCDGHGPNFYFRYQEGENRTIVNGGQTPAL